MASFFKGLFGKSPKEKKKDYPNIKMNQDPSLFWETIGELGDGAFGKVYKVRHRSYCTVNKRRVWFYEEHQI